MQKSEPLAKSEDAEKLSKAEEATNLAKAEVVSLTAKLEAALNEVVELKKTSSELGTKLHDFLTKKGPQRKAITSIEVVAKSEAEKTPAKAEVASLTKSEITARLNKKACEPSLSLADREAINKYCLVPGTSSETVKHLLS